MRRLAVAALLSIGIWACGAGTRSGGEAAHADDSEPGGHGSKDRPGDRTAAEPRGPSCDDGTCFACGEGFCPKGFFCDEKAGACSWLPECAAEASCACVTRAIESCSCNERDGGVFCE